MKKVISALIIGATIATAPAPAIAQGDVVSNHWNNSLSNGSSFCRTGRLIHIWSLYLPCFLVD